MIHEACDKAKDVCEAISDHGYTGGVSGLRVPEVKAVSAHELVIPKIHSGPASEEAMAALGEGLAQMHAVRQPEYGFDADNMIGMSPQKNRLTDDWGAFFLRDRLGVQGGMIRNDHVRKEFEAVLERQGDELARFLNEHCEHPSLLHGDLWSGNVLFDSAGPWLIDHYNLFGASYLSACRHNLDVVASL